MEGSKSKYRDTYNYPTLKWRVVKSIELHQTNLGLHRYQQWLHYTFSLSLLTRSRTVFSFRYLSISPSSSANLAFRSFCSALLGDSTLLTTWAAEARKSRRVHQYRATHTCMHAHTHRHPHPHPPTPTPTPTPTHQHCPSFPWQVLLAAS